MSRATRAAALTAGFALLAPAAADAHVSLHPNITPAGAFATLTLRVPNEMDNANTTAVRIQMPDGFLDVSAAPPPGWSFSTKTKKLAKPVNTDDGPIDTEVTEVDFTGGKLPPGQFAQFPMSVVIPGKPGDVLAFKTLQEYSNGKTARWIGTPDSDSPAPTIDVSAKNGPLIDFAGGEAGPPANAPSTLSTSSPASTPAPAQTQTKVVEKDSGTSGVTIAALLLAIVAVLLAGAALFRRPRPAPTGS
jgi:uncharacterized protein YcnI